MIIERIELDNYRNYNELNIEFDSNTNILYGDNAQGKTNILEAIYVACTTKSHRGSKDKEIIKFDQEEAHIKLTVKKRDIPYRIDMHIKKNKSKGIAINGVPIKKASELFGIVNVVLFSPEDLNIIKNGPSERRRFIDMELCQLDKVYLYNLINYNKIILQRNRLLKELSFNNNAQLFETLDIWDMQLSEYGSKIIVRRLEFINQINEIIFDIHNKLSDGKEQLIINYEPCISDNNIYQELVRTREKDIRFKTTSVGPHRDDIGFYIHDIDVRRFGSQGQQRTAALSLKLSELELVKSITNDTPILLLDDVLSELDSNRQNHLLSSLNNIQTVITCTGLDDFIENRFKINKTYRVINGTVERSNNE